MSPSWGSLCRPGGKLPAGSSGTRGGLIVRSFTGLLAYENPMTTTLRIWLVVLLVLLIGIVLAFILTPPFFVQAGKHYYGGSELANAGWYRCDARSEDTNDCEPTRESFVSALMHDPDLGNWWPIRAEFIRL